MPSVPYARRMSIARIVRQAWPIAIAIATALAIATLVSGGSVDGQPDDRRLRVRRSRLEDDRRELRVVQRIGHVLRLEAHAAEAPVPPAALAGHGRQAIAAV